MQDSGTATQKSLHRNTYHLHWIFVVFSVIYLILYFRQNNVSYVPMQLLVDVNVSLHNSLDLSVNKYKTSSDHIPTSHSVPCCSEKSRGQPGKRACLVSSALQIAGIIVKKLMRFENIPNQIRVYFFCMRWRPCIQRSYPRTPNSEQNVIINMWIIFTLTVDMSDDERITE